VVPGPVGTEVRVVPFRAMTDEEVRGPAKFFTACSTGRVDVVQGLLDQGVDLESRDTYGLTGLIWAGRKGRVGVAEVLLSRGAHLETSDRRRRTALFHAVCYRRYEFVEFLANRGANVNPVDVDGWAPLDVSTASRHKKMVDLLESLGGRRAWDPSRPAPRS
jgi:ankyrin repeat protein